MNNPPNDVPCPDRQVLEEFVRHLLPPETHRATESHISTCPDCFAVIRELSDESEPRDAGGRSTVSLVLARGAPARVAKPDEMFVPDRIGHYEVLGRIGRGGMGVVCRARHVHLKKQVAIKILPPNRLADPRTVARFEREMEVVGKLDHPNIVRATDAGYADGTHYLAMELIDGVDLAKLMRELGPLPVADACELVRQAAVGLQHAHEHGLVHRDIKPGNLMLSSKGEVKVLDLGLALLGDPSAEGLSTSGQFMGTPDYMSPEQFESTRVDIRSDVYGLGCTLFALLTGSPPFQIRGAHDTVYRRMRAHREQDVPPLATTRGEVPAGLVDVLHRMLRKDATDRQQTPAEVAGDLAPYCAGSDLTSLAAATIEQFPGNDAPPRNAETWTRHPATVQDPLPSRSRKRVLLAVGLLLVSGAVAAALAMNRSRPEESNPVPSAAVELPAEFEPGVWYELLVRRPRVAFWSADDVNRKFEHDPKEHTLDVVSTNAVLLELAVMGETPYELEATFVQTPWTGDVGLYHGGRTESPGGQPRLDAGTVTLSRLVGPVPPLYLKFGELRRTLDPPFGPIHQVVPPIHQVARPTAEPQRLGLQVGETGRIAVTWNGTPVDRPEPAVVGKRIGSAGTIGIWAHNCSTRFLSIRVRLQGAPK